MPDTPPQTTRPAPAPAPLADFAPVPRAKDRSNGWKPAVQRAFIAALAETGSVRAACRRVGRSEHGVYQMRRHPEAGEFRAAWDAALDCGVRRIEDAAMDRALYGTEETVHYHGQHVATRRRYNERLVMFILRNRAPERFAGGGARGMNAVDKMKLERLRKQWRAEWETEWDKDEQETLDDLDGMIKRMRTNREANMSPRARAAYAEARRIEEEDRGGGWMLEDGEDGEPNSKMSLPIPDARRETDQPL